MADDPRSVAFDPRAPEPERRDAMAELSAIYKPLTSELIPSGAISPVIDMIRGQLEDQEVMAKSQAVQLNRMPAEHSLRRPAGGGGMQSMYLDNLQIFMSGDYYDKPSPLGFESLRQMVEQTPFLNAIVLTRIRQISRFCQVSEDGGPGFEIKHRDKEHQMTKSEKEAARNIGRFIANCGWEFNPRERKKLRRDSFTQFMAKSVRDTLTFDACPIETEMKRNARMGMDGFYAVDGSTVRLCTEQGYEGNGEITALQVVQGRLATAYTHDSLIYEVRNPRTDVRLAGYGMGECELLVRVVTGFLNAMSYNSAGFDMNAIPKGLLQLTGEYGEDDKVAFKRMWNNMVKGINGAWSLPVMFNKDPQAKATFEKFGVDFDEMHFAKWMTFLVSIGCAIYGMAPDEINFESFAAQKSSLSGSDTGEKLASSKDLGLHPNMAFYEATMSDFIVPAMSDNMVFRWVGLKPEDQQRAWEAKKLVQSLDEMRAEEGLPAWPNKDIGCLPVNPALLSAAMQLSQRAQQAAEGGQDFGGAAPPPGEGGDYGDPDGEGQGGPGPGAGGPAGGPQGAPDGQRPAGGAGAPQGGDFGSAGGQGDFGKAFRVWAVE